MVKKKTELNKEQEEVNVTEVQPEKEEKQNPEVTNENTDTKEGTKETEARKEDIEKDNKEVTTDIEGKEEEGLHEKKEELLEEELNELRDKYVRLSAEFDNYRKRTLKEKMELTKSAGETILLNIIPVFDDFERGLESMEKTTEVEAAKQGMQLIYNKFKEFLKQNGVKEIEAIDKEFNTDEHDAVTKIPAPKEDQKGKVVDVIEKGYKLNDKVIRYAKVVVGE